MRELITKIKRACIEGKLTHAVKLGVQNYIQGLKNIIHNPASNNVVLHCPDYIEPSKEKNEMEIIGRIFNSFKKMKEDQRKVSRLYSPSWLWQQHLDVSYSYRYDAIQANDLNKFHSATISYFFTT